MSLWIEPVPTTIQKCQAILNFLFLMQMYSWQLKTHVPIETNMAVNRNTCNVYSFQKGRKLIFARAAEGTCGAEGSRMWGSISCGPPEFLGSAAYLSLANSFHLR